MSRDGPITKEPASNVPRAEIKEAAEHGEGASLSSIWKCPNCGAQIQIIIEPGREARQPFTCMCGTVMAAGEEH